VSRLGPGVVLAALLLGVPAHACRTDVLEPRFGFSLVALGGRTPAFAMRYEPEPVVRESWVRPRDMRNPYPKLQTLEPGRVRVLYVNSRTHEEVPARLLAAVELTAIFAPEQPLRIGDCYLVVLRRNQAPPPGAQVVDEAYWRQLRAVDPLLADTEEEGVRLWREGMQPMVLMAWMHPDWGLRVTVVWELVVGAIVVREPKPERSVEWTIGPDVHLTAWWLKENEFLRSYEIIWTDLKDKLTHYEGFLVYREEVSERSPMLLGVAELRPDLGPGLRWKPILDLHKQEQGDQIARLDKGRSRIALALIRPDGTWTSWRWADLQPRSLRKPDPRR